MKLKYKIWLDQDGKAFGSGPYAILLNIKKYGSLSEAARVMDISYSKAWKTVNMVEKRLGLKLLTRKTGGSDGGGSCLTDEAELFLKKYEDFRNEADEMLKCLFNKHFNEFLGNGS